MPTDSDHLGLSKSRFVKGWQCHNLLWWTVHDPDAEELRLGPATLDLFEQGRQVGALARARFPGGVLIDLPHGAVEERVAATQAVIDGGAPAVFEAAFAVDGVFVALDVLERAGENWHLIEVKSATRRKKEEIADIAVQLHVARACGLDVRRADLMHLNPDYRHPDVGDLFVREDVTAEVTAFLQRVPEEIATQLAVLRGDFPDLRPGEQCAGMRACPFKRRCWPDDRDHVLKLSGKGVRKALELMAEGIHRIQDIPDGTKLSDVNRRQKLALAADRLAVEPALREALDTLRPPAGFLDFETVSRAIPVWDGLAPWGAVPVQFSYHEETGDGEYRHVAWLADGPEDPRTPLAQALLEACAGAGSIVTYTDFEAKQIRHLVRTVPALAPPLQVLATRLWDLKEAIKDTVYHPDFAGSFSIKDVLPALVPELSYEHLAIQGGQDASVEIARLMLRGHDMAPDDRERLRADLLAYCELDTWGMVKLLERLRFVAAMVEPG